MRAAIKHIKDKWFNGHLTGVEVGVERGDHASEILVNLNMKKLYLIDIWEPFEQEGKSVWDDDITKNNFNTVIDRFKNLSNIEIIKGKSLEIVSRFPDASLDFVYIDASHQYPDVYFDLLAWAPKVRQGGVLCGHDYIDVWPGVIKSVLAFYNENLQYEFKSGNTSEEPVPDWWMEIK